MKKKRLFSKLFCLSILLTSLVSCSKNDKINVRKINNLDSFVYITDIELIDLLKHKEDFVLVVGEDGCSTCEYIKDPFIKFIKKYETIIYWIESPQYEKACKNEDFKLNSNVLSSTVLIFDDGQIKSQIDYDANLYFSKDKLDYTLSKYISSHGLYDINDYVVYKYNNNVNMYKLNLSTKEKLDSLINSNKKVTILYSWKECGDCHELKTSFLNDFIKTYTNVLYEYEVDAIRSKRKEDGTYDLDSFTIFATEKEFASYRNGKVPTLVTYENGKKTDMIVFSNDVIEEKENKYYVKESFHESLLNKESNDKLALHNLLIKEEIKLIKDYLTK